MEHSMRKWSEKTEVKWPNFIFILIVSDFFSMYIENFHGF